ncbi:MAG TPA: hypothetical protein VLF94_08795, partial [Chlamydiales bacterium]|nr:hypothetical protein [Chlamydiales bacterium]
MDPVNRGEILPDYLHIHQPPLAGGDMACWAAAAGASGGVCTVGNTACWAAAAGASGGVTGWVGA